MIYCDNNSKSIEECSLEELKRISDVFDEDVYSAISLKTCVEKRMTKGGPGSFAIMEFIKYARDYLDAL